MRVTLCCDACDIGGAERYVLDLGEDLSLRGHQVRVVLSECQREGALEAELLARGLSEVTHLASGVYPRHRALSIHRAARRLFASGNTDVIHFSLHHADSCRYWISAAASCRVPFVLTEHAVSPGFLHASRATFVAKRFSYRRAAHIVFVGGCPRESVEAELGRLPNASVIYPGVAVERSREGPSRGDVVFMGRWSEQKDPLLAVRAFNMAIPDSDEIEMYVFGGGPLESELRRHCEGVSSRVHLLGWSKDPAKDVSRGGVFLQTSRWENTPYAILDAMGHGRTVVAYAVGDVRRMLASGYAGLPVAPGDFDGLVAALKRAVSDPQLRARFATAAPARVRSAYSRSEMVERTIAVYENALRKPARQ